MELKKVNLTAVEPIIDGDYNSLSQDIRALLGNDNPFADRIECEDSLLYCTTDGEWKSMSEADDIEMIDILDKMVDTKAKVCGQLEDDFVEQLFTYPDDDYVFFTHSTDGIKVLITGWGYRKNPNYVEEPVVMPAEEPIVENVETPIVDDAATAMTVDDAVVPTPSDMSTDFIATGYVPEQPQEQESVVVQEEEFTAPIQISEEPQTSTIHFCQNCGHDIKPGMLFCPGCGFSIGGNTIAETPAVSTTSVAPAAITQPASQTVTPQAGQQEMAYNHGSSDAYILAIILGGFLAIVFIGIIAYIIISILRFGF